MYFLLYVFNRQHNNSVVNADSCIPSSIYIYIYDLIPTFNSLNNRPYETIFEAERKRKENPNC